MPKAFWPDDGGKWTVECMSVEQISTNVFLYCTMIEGPITLDIGQESRIPMSHKKHRPDCSISAALKANYPNATTPCLIYQAQAHYACVYGAITGSVPVTAPTIDTKWKPTTVNKPSLAVTAFFRLQALTWSALSAVAGDILSLLSRREPPLPAQPHSQRDARSRPDWARWVAAEQIEMGVCYDKGTFDIVDLPPGISELPSMFQYKLKLRLNGDLIIALATQHGLMLFQFDVRGAFLCADVDTDIYLKLQPGISHSLGKQPSSEKVSTA
eukprot:1291358-Rhodomonas_salina.2